jgi:hypothetical protein
MDEGQPCYFTCSCRNTTNQIASNDFIIIWFRRISLNLLKRTAVPQMTMTCIYLGRRYRVYLDMMWNFVRK